MFLSVGVALLRLTSYHRVYCATLCIAFNFDFVISRYVSFIPFKEIYHNNLHLVYYSSVGCCNQQQTDNYTFRNMDFGVIVPQLD